MSLEAIATDETGGVIVEKKANSGIEGKIADNYDSYIGKKVMDAETAIKYLRYWEQQLEHSGKMPLFKNYLERNKIKVPVIKAYSAHTNLPKEVRAYSSPLLGDGNPKKLEVIGIPADFHERIKQDKELLNLSEEQLMHFYLVHEYLHHALNHKPGYENKLDYAIKEGDDAKHSFRHFKEERDRLPMLESYYKPMVKLAAFQYVSHKIMEADIKGKDSVLDNKDFKEALKEIGIPALMNMFMRRYRLPLISNYN